MTFATVTFGCKVNQYETQMMRELLGAFFVEAAPNAPADVVLINTCSVTQEAERQARKAMRRARKDHPGAKIVAAGCYARRPGVDLVAEGIADSVVSAPAAEALLASLGLAGDAKTPAITRMDGHARAFVKAQDGCDRKCTFCVIPSIRGTSVSRPLAEIMAESTGLAGSGVPEIVLCGVRLNAYKDPATGQGLADLVDALAGIDALPRIRLSSLYPGKIEERLLDLVTKHPKLAPHLHLPIQSGSDAVLKAMGRGYTRRTILDLVDALKRRNPEIGLTADILVGFPGETEQDARDTEEIVSECGFHHLHRFPFSARPGTPAEKMIPVDESAVTERMGRLGALGERLRAQALDQRIGTIASIVVERKGRDGGWRGITGDYFQVRFDDPNATPATLRNVRITGLAGTELAGVPC